MSAVLYYDGNQQNAESPVLPSLCTTMQADLVVSPEGNVWIVHDRPFPLGLIWAEYDVDTAALYLVARDGRIIDFGMKIFPETRKYLRKARQLVTMRMTNGKLDDSYTLPLLVRETGHYNG